MVAHAQAAQVPQGGNQADGSMAAHAKKAYVVKENDAGCAGAVCRLHQQRAHQHAGAARFVDHRRAEGVVFVPKHLQLVGDTTAAQGGTAADYHPGRLAGSMRINDGNPSHAAVSRERRSEVGSPSSALRSTTFGTFGRLAIPW